MSLSGLKLQIQNHIFHRPKVMFKRFSYLRDELIVSHACKLFNDESFKGLSGFHCRFNNLESQSLKTCRESTFLFLRTKKFLSMISRYISLILATIQKPYNYFKPQTD